ncbi:MAG: porin family protein [Elusimicrobia bacterium]|nr:porin family protein [Elusimicrobiota bacterium]
MRIPSPIQSVIPLFSAVLFAIAMSLSFASGAEAGGDFDFQSGSFGFRGMYFEPKDSDEGDWHGGVQLRLFLVPAFALEGSVDYRQNDFGETELNVFPVQASALIYLLPDRRLSPLLLGGAGWYYTQVEGPGAFDDTDHRFGTHAGGGLQVGIGESVSLDTTYRYIWLEEFKSKGADLTEKEFEDSGHMVTVGLNFHF